MTSHYFLAIDQGGQSTRVAVYKKSGEQLCVFSAPCVTQHYTPENSHYEHIEQNGEEILAGIKDCLQKIQDQLGDDIRHIKGAGFAGQGSSLLCWNNQTGEALTPVLSWQDIRGEPYLQELPLTHKQAQQLTGLRVSPHYGASKIRWCLEHNENVQAALSKNQLSIGPIVSYLFWHLLNKKTVVDPGHAQRTLLWNLHRNDWDKTLLDFFAIPRVILPSCQYHNSHFGNLQLGNHAIPFAASARDQGASLFARGIPDKNTCYINIGTGAFIQRVSETLQAAEGLLVSPLWIPEIKPQPQTIDVSSPTCYAEELDYANTIKPLYAWEATVNGAASAISYMQQQTGLEITPEQINQALTLNPEKPCYFLNSIGGLSAPYWRTDLQAIFSPDLTPHEKILAWIESVIFQIAVNVELMNQLGKVEKIIISGGFNKSDLVCQKIADLTQAKVHRSDNADATLLGIAAMATGLSPEWTPLPSGDLFSSGNNPELLNRYGLWRCAMKKWLEK